MDILQLNDLTFFKEIFPELFPDLRREDFQQGYS